MKFRVWSKKHEMFANDPRWPSNQYTHEQVVLTPEGEIWTLVTTDGENYFRDSSGGEYIIQRATGLKDAKGKEIYEGDILAYSLDGNLFQDEVIWEHFGWVLRDFQVKSSFPLTNGLEYKIIGNILENPDLCN